MSDPHADAAPDVRRPPRELWLAGVVFLAAFAMRLVPVLRDGGLFGLLGYDGAVYYAAASGLAHGLVPYADFLLLHPPGITLALLPFALLGRVVGDPDAMAVARVVWMGLGGVSAVLLVRIFRRWGRVAALGAGLLYAVYVPAIVVERTTALEAVTTVCTLGAVLLLVRTDTPRTAPPAGFVVAGLLLAASSGTKIWGVVLLVAVLGWCLAVAGLRRALLVVLGAGVGLVALCLPFFVQAPVTMWRMVVEAQVGRRRVPVDLRTKLVDVAGLSEVQVRHGTELLVGVGVLVLVCAAVALTHRTGRLGVVLLVATLGLLAASPAWSVDYASLVAAPLALVLGATLAQLSRWLRRRTLQGLLVVPVLATVGIYAYLSIPTTTFGPTFPGRTIAAIVADTPGCVTSDDPTTLIEADVLGRNFDRGCPLMADLGGYSYYLQPGARQQTGRAANEQWQGFYRDYLASGGATVVVRFREDVGLTAQTRDVIGRWPVLGVAGPYEVRVPAP